MAICGVLLLAELADGATWSRRPFCAPAVEGAGRRRSIPADGGRRTGALGCRGRRRPSQCPHLGDRHRQAMMRRFATLPPPWDMAADVQAIDRSPTPRRPAPTCIRAAVAGEYTGVAAFGIEFSGS